MRIPSIECGHIPVFFKPQPFWPSCLFTTPRGTRLVPMRRRPVASPVRQSSLADVSFLDVKVIEELLQRLPDHLREQAKEDLQRRLNPDSRQRLGIGRSIETRHAVSAWGKNTKAHSWHQCLFSPHGCHDAMLAGLLFRCFDSGRGGCTESSWELCQVC